MPTCMACHLEIDRRIKVASVDFGGYFLCDRHFTVLPWSRIRELIDTGKMKTLARLLEAATGTEKASKRPESTTKEFSLESGRLPSRPPKRTSKKASLEPPFEPSIEQVRRYLLRMHQHGGYSDYDLAFGTSLGKWVQQGRPLTDKQLEAAKRMLKKYRKRLGA